MSPSHVLAHDLMRLTARSTHFVLTATAPNSKLRLIKAPLTYMHTSHNELVYTTPSSSRAIVFPKSEHVNVTLAAYRNGMEMLQVKGRGLLDADSSIADAHTIYDVDFATCNDIVECTGLHASMLFSIIDCPLPDRRGSSTSCETVVSDATVYISVDAFDALISRK